jgi:hypothetical protein
MSPKRHEEKIAHSSEDPNWRTPPALYNTLDKFFSFTCEGAGVRSGGAWYQVFCAVAGRITALWTRRSPHREKSIAHA